MFERFTDRARRVIVLAQAEARLLEHGSLGTEHMLLGLVKEGEGVGAKVLQSLDVSLYAVRSQVVGIIGKGDSTPGAEIPFTPRAKKVLELSLHAAVGFHHNYIGTEHILLGLIAEADGVAAQVLANLGVSLDAARARVLEHLNGGTEAPDTSGLHRFPSTPEEPGDEN